MPTEELKTTETIEKIEDLKTEEVQISQDTTTPPLAESKTEEVPAVEEVAGLAEAVEEMEEYELSKRDNTKLSDEDFDAFIQEAIEKGYSKETAEALLKAKEDAADKYSEEYYGKGLEELKVKTHTDLMKDEKFNTPEKYSAAVDDAKLVLSHFGDTDLAEAFKNPIVGSNPALFKFILRIANVMKSEGTEELNRGDAKSMQSPGAKNFLDSFYPDM